MHFHLAAGRAEHWEGRGQAVEEQPCDRIGRLFRKRCGRVAGIGELRGNRFDGAPRCGSVAGGSLLRAGFSADIIRSELRGVTRGDLPEITDAAE